MGKLFGTDGLRARAGEFPLEKGAVYRLGQALAVFLKERGQEPRILIGRDTRESGQWLEEYFCSGFVQAGGQAISAGVITTPGVSFLTRKGGFSAGVVVSASHNPYDDNGIKIFSPAGTKIPEDWEDRIEQALAKGRLEEDKIKIEPVEVDHTLKAEYLDSLKKSWSGNKQDKLKLVVDCANGASSELAPELFRALNFKVVAINNTPDGRNINAVCGSLHPENLARAVVEQKADLGIAYDGDADRAIWADEHGHILSGDHTLYLLALYFKEKSRLKNNLVVATTMSNLGLEQSLAENGIKLIRTRVGDKYVFEEMINRQTNLGGEQSGHTILLDYAVTGDGLLTSLKILEIMLETGRSLSELVKGFKLYPQILINLKVREKVPLKDIPGYNDIIEDVSKELGPQGRLEVRYSGTEPLARIMMEGPDEKKLQPLARRIASLIDGFCGQK
ncbi:MAG TPA: phosphoglucosamine mutase [Candidatus Saccharicenans sp.]|jgi:phosphoglucosamine mutase|nr:phosphoglucosamine mutase [Candidatus Saccharicenans sp.]HRD02006.1 phosphoglucosamine mutase [Candidatus Saccharicenans sp.]